MRKKLPRSPFATLLSGSARETELRIRSIFQWKKQRPPAWLMLLSALAVLGCGGLVSCQEGQEGGPPASSGRPGGAVGPAIVMDVQYYDVYENLIEIPMLVPPEGAQADEGVTAINRALTGLKGEYQDILDGVDPGAMEEMGNAGKRCLFYPVEDGRYLNLVFFREKLSDGSLQGHISTLTYDKAEGRQATLADALALAETTEEKLYDALARQMGPEYARQYPLHDVRIQEQALVGFRLRADGAPVFYLSARAADWAGRLSPMHPLFIWEEGSFTLWDQHLVDGPPLVPLEEILSLEIPLYCQWSPTGEGPEGGYVNPVSSGLAEEDQQLLALLFQQALNEPLFDTSFPVQQELLATLEGEGYTLGAAHFNDYYPRYSLVVGVMSNERPELVGPVFQASSSGGIPHVVTFERDGTKYLLYTVTGMHQGWRGGEGGLIAFDGDDFTWVWPVEGDLRDRDSQAWAGYVEYWRGKMPLMCPGGVEVFEENPDYGPYDGSPPQWSPGNSHIFYAAPENGLPAGTLHQVRVWLEEFTRNEYNPWRAINVSAAWRILSLTPNGVQPHPETGEELARYDLLACAEESDEHSIAAVLLTNPDSGAVLAALGWHIGDREEVERAFSLPAFGP